ARFFLARVRFDPNRCGLESSVWIVRRLPRTPRKIRRLSVMTWRENHDEESVRAAGSTSNVERQFGNRRGARHADHGLPKPALRLHSFARLGPGSRERHPAGDERRFVAKS